MSPADVRTSRRMTMADTPAEKRETPEGKTRAGGRNPVGGRSPVDLVAAEKTSLHLAGERMWDLEGEKSPVGLEVAERTSPHLAGERMWDPAGERSQVGEMSGGEMKADASLDPEKTKVGREDVMRTKASGGGKTADAETKEAGEMNGEARREEMKDDAMKEGETSLEETKAGEMKAGGNLAGGKKISLRQVP